MLMSLPATACTLFPYTTLFRSEREHELDADLGGAFLRPLPALGARHFGMGAEGFRDAGAEAVCLHQHGHQGPDVVDFGTGRSEEHTSELQSPCNIVYCLLLEEK